MILSTDISRKPRKILLNSFSLPREHMSTEQTFFMWIFDVGGVSAKEDCIRMPKYLMPYKLVNTASITRKDLRPTPRGNFESIQNQVLGANLYEGMGSEFPYQRSEAIFRALTHPEEIGIDLDSIDIVSGRACLKLLAMALTSNQKFNGFACKQPGAPIAIRNAEADLFSNGYFRKAHGTKRYVELKAVRESSQESKNLPRSIEVGVFASSMQRKCRRYSRFNSEFAVCCCVLVPRKAIPAAGVSKESLNSTMRESPARSIGR